MFLLSIRLSRKRLLAGAAALIVLVGLGIFGARALRGGDAMTSAAPISESARESSKAKKVVCKTSQERLAFIRSFGWEVEEEPLELQEVIIPKEFDNVYMQYNAIQKKQGYDLEAYAGKRCKRYSYRITNHPDEGQEVRFNLLLHNDRVVGGDVCSTDQDGFLHGFVPQ